MPNKLHEAGHSVDIEGLTKRFGTFVALDDVSLRVEAGEFLSLLGPSGSGKSTLLMAIAGFVTCDSGRIRIDGADISHLPAERRDLGVVFQGYALFPHMTVAENIAYPLRVRGLSRSAIEDRLASVLEVVKLGPLRDQLPAKLSGGQQQRVALARAFVFGPKTVLLDEPLSALDKQLRSELQFELKRIHQQLGTTFINVTHDQEEAMAMSDRVAVMQSGSIVQVGTPREIYDAPGTEFVSTFVGHAASLPGEVVAVRDRVASVRCGDQVFDVAQSAGAQAPGRRVRVVLRPERLQIMDHGGSGDGNAISGTIESSVFLGAEARTFVTTAFGRIVVSKPSSLAAGRPAADGSRVWITWMPADAILVEVPSSGASDPAL